MGLKAAVGNSSIKLDVRDNDSSVAEIQIKVIINFCMSVFKTIHSFSFRRSRISLDPLLAAACPTFLTM